MKLRVILGVMSILLAGVPLAGRADVKLPSILGSHMVLQCDQPLPIWGWADAGEDITVRFGAHKATTQADKDGHWKVTLPVQKADNEGRNLIVKGKNRIELEDILIGEVWVGSGQSNMEWTVKNSKGGPQAVADAQHARIRLFHVPLVKHATPAADVHASWKTCSPETVPGFSGVLYFFGLRLHADLKVPVGLINSCWGGSPIEPWTVTAKGSGEMYNGMIAPLQPFAIRGVIWYQGETNVFKKDGRKYYDKMKELVDGWRKTWGEKMPFYYVQIAPWSGYPKGEEPRLWEAQVASLKIPYTGMAVVTDLVDDVRDIHPPNKQPVGDRLARWALAKTYSHKKNVYSGPLYKSMKIDGAKIRLNFAHVGGGLRSRDGNALTEFRIAGKDGKFVRAEAVIDGDTVVVSAKGVAAPTQVRFGWHKTANPNLMNKEGLPASPFQTKDWQGGTGE